MAKIEMKSIDHIVMTCEDIQKTIEFYTYTLGMKLQCFGENRFALRFGCQKINLHQKGKEFEPKADKPTAGSVDICLISETPVDDVKQHLEELGIKIILGPVEKTGANGKLNSIYFRDPDKNLVEVSNYKKE